ncbi:MAG: cytidylyltransferase [Candidatus Omnitrophica bacterium]|nr:cytidylyltransferase [Candidatus Omnitrophota bacterium]
MVAALLLGREGSVGFPGKNMYPVLGKPLSYYPMAAARKAATVDEVFLSTDSKDLMKLADSLGIKIIKRPAELCTNEATGLDAFLHGYKVIRDLYGSDRIEFMILMFCNAPTVTPQTIDEGVKVLRANPLYDSAVTVSRYNMWSPLRARRIGEDGLLHPFVPFEALGDPSTFNCNRDSQGDAWFADVAVSVVRPGCLDNIEDGLLPQKWMGRKIYPLKQWGGLDVDYEWQIPQAEYWLKKNGYGEK